MKYVMECSMGHEPMKMWVEADSEEQAMKDLMPQVRDHLNAMHSDMAGKSDAELEEMIKGMWHTEEADAGTAPAAM